MLLNLCRNHNITQMKNVAIKIVSKGEAEMTYNIKNGKENTKEMDYNNSSGRIIVIHILSIFSFPVFYVVGHFLTPCSGLLCCHR